MNLTNTIGWTLIHFLWQGALIAVLLAGTLAFLRRANSRVRYAASCAAMVLMLLCAAATFIALQWSGDVSLQTALRPAPSLPAPTFAAALSGRSGMPLAGSVAAYLPMLVWLWFAGVVALSVRAFGGWVVAARLARRHTRPAEAAWKEKCAALVQRLCISRTVRLAVSARAQVPTVVGWIRPIVLMPATIFTGLNAEQIEALLAHELAHVRRHDYLVNLLQTAAETLFFYHPGVWWVNRTIRNERENCCDDLAVEICGNTLEYVRALTELEQLRGATPRIAMAADGGSLLSRVQRLLRLNPSGSSAPSGLLAVLALAVCLSVVGIAASGLAERPQNAGVRAEAVEAAETAVGQQQGVRPAAPNSASSSTQNAQTSVARPPQAPQENKAATTWLDEIEAAGFRNLNVDQLIRLKEHDIDGAYIKQVRAAGFDLSADQLVRFREHEISSEFIDQIRQLGFTDVKVDDLIRLKEHEADAAWIRQVQALGFPNTTLDNVIRLREHDVTPEFIRQAQSRFKDLSLDQLIRLKEYDILK